MPSSIILWNNLCTPLYYYQTLCSRTYRTYSMYSMYLLHVPTHRMYSPYLLHVLHVLTVPTARTYLPAIAQVLYSKWGIIGYLAVEYTGYRDALTGSPRLSAIVRYTYLLILIYYYVTLCAKF